MRGTSPFLLLAALCCLFVAPALGADNEAESGGQEDLNSAAALKLSASSMSDLEQVIELCESAISKGLDDDSQQLAKSLLTATLFQHGARYAQALFDPNERSQRPAMLKQFALRDLYRILQHDDNLPKVHMMIARLEAVNANPNGQGIRRDAFEKGKRSVNRAVELFKANEDNSMLSKAYVLRAGYQRGVEQMDDINAAIVADKTNKDAWRLRGRSRLVEGELLSAQGKLEESKAAREKALADFTSLLELDPRDANALQAIAELLGKLGNHEAALAKAQEAIEAKPGSASLYRMRARLHRVSENYELAIKDLNLAIDIQPDSFLAFLDRCDAKWETGERASAAKDFTRAREIEPGMAQVILQGITIRSQADLNKQIAELKKMVDIDALSAKQSERKPDPLYSLQLGTTYLVAERPQQAIEVTSGSLDAMGDDKDQRNARFVGLRTRGDAYLAIGKHAEAIADYDGAYELKQNDDSILNNLAWVLATSPFDELRNADRSILLATRACKLTDYQEAHILSTLAAGYAEKGDWDSAIKWSTQAVKLGEQKIDAGTVDQLKLELASYQAKKPWRELQEPKTEADANAAKDGEGAAEQASEEDAAEQAGDDSGESEGTDAAPVEAGADQ